jgi:hypothetical protein
VTEYTPAGNALARTLNVDDQIALKPSTSPSGLDLVDPYHDNLSSPDIEWHPITATAPVDGNELLLTLDNDLTFTVLLTTTVYARTAYEPQEQPGAFIVTNASTGAVIAWYRSEASARTRARSSRAVVGFVADIANYS